MCGGKQTKREAGQEPAQTQPTCDAERAGFDLISNGDSSVLCLCFLFKRVTSVKPIHLTIPETFLVYPKMI